MSRFAFRLKALTSAAAILILAAGCSQSPTAPAPTQDVAPSAPSFGTYAVAQG
jgi:hypothetical protein